MPKPESEHLEIDGRRVAISNPQKVLFPETGHTKLDLVRYFLTVAGGALRGAGGRPNVLVRYPNGIHEEFFYQKRAPQSRPDWIEVAALQFPSGRTAQEVVPRDAAALAWMANLACLELHPHPVRADDLDHPDELRVDLDPVAGVEWSQLQEVARIVHATLDDFGLIGWPKTSGSRGLHVYVPLAPGTPYEAGVLFGEIVATLVAHQHPRQATVERAIAARGSRVYVDYLQNGRGKTLASAYSARASAYAGVSTPLTWDEVEAGVDLEDFTIKTVPDRLKDVGDLWSPLRQSRGVDLAKAAKLLR